MQAIQGYLEELTHYATLNVTSSSEVVYLAADLRAYLKEVTDNDLGMCSSLLFESPISLLNFLIKTTQNKDLAGAKEEILDLMLDYLKQIGAKGVQTYAISIVEACFTVFRSDPTSKVKIMCLPIINKLIQMKVSTVTAESLRVQHRVEVLLTELQYSKNSQTVKGGILQALGILAEYFPEHLVNQAKTLLVMLSSLLAEQFKDKKPDYQVIEGAMKGLASLLVNFSGEVTSDPSKIATIWKFTLACLNPPEGLKTYAIPKAGLQMVEKHAVLFRQHLTDKAQVVYPYIKNYCTHATNRSIRRFGFGALEAFLTQVAREIVTELRSKEANETTLRYFFEEFWAGLQERNVGLLASSVFVRGLGIFARSIDFYMGPSEVKKMLHKLIVFSGRFYSSPTYYSSTNSDPSSSNPGNTQNGENENSSGSTSNDAEEVIEHMPSILASYANIIMELPDIDEACTDALERILGTFFLVYPQLYDHQRWGNYKSISRLFVSLYSKGSSLQTLLSRIIFKGLILTCSKPVTENNATGTATNATEFFFEYQELWKNLLDVRRIAELELDDEIYQEISALIYKELMQSCIKMLRKLDLRYSVVKETDLNNPIDLISPVDLDESISFSQLDSLVNPDVSSSQVSSSSQTSSASSGSLPSAFSSSMDVDGVSLSQQAPRSPGRAKPVSNINKNEFIGCAKTMMAGETLKPWVPKDFELFLHLVEFLKLFLPSIKPTFFGPWVLLFFKEVISKSTDFPLISGLYKLLGVGLKICASVGFFKGIGLKGLIILPTAAELNVVDNNNKRLCFKLVTKFLRELLLRLRQYRDELLASCIQTVLSIPKEFLDIQAFTPCLVRAFKMGLGFLPLTDIGLTALERWHEEQPKELEAVLPQILPVLNPYLYITKEEVETNLASNERFAASNNANSWVFGYGGDKPGSGTNKDLATTANEYRPEHSIAMQANLQVRILRLLGKLGGRNASVISDVEGASHGVAWDSTPRVSIELAFNGGVLRVFLDDLLPALCHLATTASSRQIKIAACEFVRAVCLNLTNQDDGKGAFENIYAKLFPIVVQLSADVEKITRQLFEPLTVHLIRWSIMTGAEKATQVLLSTLTDALSSETDGALRSFASHTLTQFLKIYFELKRGRTTLTSLFSLLHSLAAHPNPYKRLGSVMSFHQLVRVMHVHRMETQFDHSLIQLLEIMNSMFSALQLTKVEHLSVVGIENQALQVIDQLGNLIQHFSESLFAHGLSHFVTHLFISFCGHIRRPVRACAQTLFVKLVRLLPTSPSPHQWLINRINGAGDMYDVFDKPIVAPTKSSKARGSLPSGSGSMPASNSLDIVGSQNSNDDEDAFSFKTTKEVSLDVFEGEEMPVLFEKATKSHAAGHTLEAAECLRWFNGLSAWVDSMFWLLSNGIITMKDLIGSSSTSKTESIPANAVFKQCLFYLKVYAMMDLESGLFASLTPQELETHTLNRSNTTLSVFSLASCMLERGANTLISDSLYRCLAVCVLAPHRLGFPLFNAQDQRRVRKSTTRLTGSILRNLSTSLDASSQESFTRFTSSFTTLLNRKELGITNLNFTAGAIDVENMRHISVGLLDLDKLGVLKTRLKNYAQLAQQLFGLIAANHTQCSPLELSAMRKVMKLALNVPFDVPLLLDYLKDTNTSSNAMQVDGSAADTNTSNRRHATKGEMFYRNFKAAIDAYMTLNVLRVLRPLLTLAATSHPHMFKLVLAVLDNQIQESKAGRLSPERITEIFDILGSTMGSNDRFFESWITNDSTLDQREAMLDYLKKISALSASQALKHEKLRPLIIHVWEIFLSRETPLWFKNRSLPLLSPFLPHLSPEHLPRILKPIELMIVFDYPSKSTLLSPDSAAYAEYINSLDILLSTLSSSFSVDLLEAVFPILNEANHVHMVAIDKTLELFVRGVRPEDSARLFKTCFDAFLDATPNLETLRLALIRKICVPLMLSMRRSTLLDALKDHNQAGKIFGIVFPVLPEITSPKPDSRPPIIDRQAIIARVGAFHLIQTIFASLTQAERDELNPLIPVPSPLQKSDSLTQKAMRCAFAVRNKRHADYTSDVSSEIQLEYQHAAYHCLATVIMKAQPTNIKFYEVFGFTEDVKKGNLLWERIVNLDQKFVFTVETNFPIANKHVSSIYSKASQKLIDPSYTRDDNATMAATGALSRSLNPKRYLTSSYFSDSSLSQFVGDSAFFLPGDPKSPVMSPKEDHNSGDKMDVDFNSPPASLDESLSGSKVGPPAEIELDALNNNPCMFNMLDMIDDINLKFPQTNQGEFMPVWMQELYNKLNAGETPLNVKLFITKIVMNKLEAFEKFSADFFAPLCCVLLQNMESVGNPGFNYFVRDLCIVFLRWPLFVPTQAEHKALAAQFMEYLIRNATHASRSIITSNLQIIKLLVERWKICLTDKIPRKLLIDLISLERKSSRASRFYRLVGIQILGAIVTNKMGLWNDANYGPAVAKRNFLESIVNLLTYSYKEVHQAAGELIGLAFFYQSPGADETLHQLVVEKLTSLFNSEDLSKFVAVLERMTKHYPMIIDVFLERILVSLKKFGDLKAKVLELAVLRVSEMSDPYAALVSNLDSLLRHRDDATQIAMLNILHEVYSAFPHKELVHLVPILTVSFAQHVNDNVRRLYLDLLMKLYDLDVPELNNDEALRLALLKGMADPSEEVAKVLFDFWDNNDKLAAQPSARLHQLMSKFYHPDVETHWLKMSTHLMLRLFKGHKTFEAVISTLAQGTDFNDISIDDSSTTMAGIMEPSAATYVKQTLSDSQMMMESSIERTSPAKKAQETYSKYHTLYFDSVVGPGISGVGNSNYTQANTNNSSITASTATVQSGSSFKTPTKQGRPTQPNDKAGGNSMAMMPPPRTPPPRFNRQSNNGTQIPSPTQSGTYLDVIAPDTNESRVRVTRRFAHSPVASMGSTHYFRQRELAKRKEREAQARDMTRKRLHHVQLHRKYASGVKTISNKDIVDPLLTVALKNDTISRLLLANLVGVMRDDIDAAVLQTTLGEILQSSLAGSLHSDTSLPSTAQQVISSSISTPFINCLLRIAHDHPILVIPSRLIADCAIKSLNFHLGIITLEKQVIKYETMNSAAGSTTSGKSRSRKSTNSQRQVSGPSPLIDDAWAQLVRLYKILGEEDVLHGLYEKPAFSTRDELKRVLEAELEGEYEDAKRLYGLILDGQHSLMDGIEQDGEDDTTKYTENEMDICQAGFLNCLSKLSEWKQVSDVVLQHVSGDRQTYQSLDTFQYEKGTKLDPLAGLWSPLYREKYMRPFLTSCILEKDRFNFIMEWVDHIGEKRATLEGEFSSELAFISTLKNDLGRADSYIRQAFRHFLGSWSALPPSMASAAQHKLLQTLQPLLELEEYLTFATSLENFTGYDAMHKLLETWRARYPHQRLDDFQVWEKVCGQRTQYFNIICTTYIENLKKNGDKDKEKPAVDMLYVKKTLRADRDLMNVRLAVTARKQNRFGVSDKLLSAVEAKLPQGKPQSFPVFLARLKTDVATVRHAFGLSGTSHSSKDSASSSTTAAKPQSASNPHISPPTVDLLKSYSSLWERITSRENILAKEAVDHYARLNLVKSKLLLDILDMQTVYSSQFAVAWKALPVEDRKPFSFIAAGTLPEVGKEAYNAIFSAAGQTSLLGKTHFQYAKFCDKIASRSASDDANTANQYWLDAVTHMFEAIKNNHSQALGYVPFILRILSSTRSSQDPNTVTPAMKLIGQQFTTYKSQIPVWIWLRWLNHLVGLMDHPEFAFVLPILESIAEAYPQSIYYHFRISTDKDFGTKPVPARLSKLQELVSNDLLDKFVSGMEQMTNPEHRAKAWLTAIGAASSKGPLQTKLYRAFVDDCLVNTYETGDVNRQFASKIVGRDVRERGLDGTAPVDKDFISKVYKAVNDVCNSFSTISDKANTLSHYNKWLDSYSSGFGSKSGEIEVPGQYSGYSKPQPDQHVKISSFDKSLLIMSSMRKPKRLKIRGTDEKEYWFLVKGGEDLRQDQRVEQLFDIFNHLLKVDSGQSSNSKLTTYTYSVVPMTTRAGILEWIRNTIPLKALIDAQSHPGWKNCVEEHDKLIGRGGKNAKANLTDLYKLTFKRVTYDEVSLKLAKQHSYLPGDLLRSKIIALSADPEAFLGVRAKAATSIAVFSIASYIIGIGDRHLDNFLINMKDGEFIGIDFGYAFDAATLLLPIPEMVPFRLTRQMTQLLKPLDSDGLLKLTMIKSMTTLVRNRELIVDAMDVFANEPLLDWSQWATRLPGKPNIEIYTRDRLRSVQQKLSLYDPGYITSTLLKLSVHHAEDYCSNLTNILMPKNGKKQCSSIKAQVERLIEQATNPFILGTGWSGWSPWV